MEIRQRQLRERKWHVARHTTLVLQEKKVPPFFCQVAPQKALLCRVPSQAHWTIPCQVPHTSPALSFLWVSSVLFGGVSFWLGLGFCSSNPETILLDESVPTMGEGVLCALNEVHREGKTGQLSSQKPLCTSALLFVFFFFLFVSSCFELKQSMVIKPVPASMATESSPTGNG